jgi:uncharacterized protein with PIN domain
MVIDTSALVAIVLRESLRDALLDAIGSAKTHVRSCGPGQGMRP